MSTPRSQTPGRRGELRAEMENRVQLRRERPMPAWLSTPVSRRVTAMLPAAVLVLGVVAAMGGSMVSVVLLAALALVGAAGTLTLRRVTQMLDTAPARLLDERELEQRNRAHRLSHGWTLAVFGALWALAVVEAVISRITAIDLFGPDGWVLLTLAGVIAASMLPAAVLAWSWQPLPDDSDR